MEIHSTRFGQITCDAHDCVVFPDGVIGFEDLKLWVLLVDHQLTWLQSVEAPEIALPLANPFDFLPDYRVRLTPEDRKRLAFPADQRPLVLVVANRVTEHWTLNLQAPLLICLQTRLGWQVVGNDEQPLRYALPRSTVVLRKTA